MQIVTILLCCGISIVSILDVFLCTFFFFPEQHANSVIFLSIGCKIHWKVGGRGHVLPLSELYEDILLVIEMS